MSHLETLYQELRAYKRSRAFCIAIRNGLLDLLSDGPMETHSIAEKRHIPVNIIHSLITVLYDMRLVTRHQDRYTLTNEGRQAAQDQTLRAFAGYHDYGYKTWITLPELCRSHGREGMNGHQHFMSDESFCEAYLNSMEQIARPRIGAIESVTRPLLQGDLLDVGAGPSTFGRYIANKAYCKVVALDFPEMVQTASRLFETPENFVWQSGDFESYVPDRLFDVIFCGHIVEYLGISSFNRWLNRMKNMLKKDGSVVIVSFLRNEGDDESNCRLDLFELSTGLNGRYCGRVFDRVEIQEYLHTAGFGDITISSLDVGPSYNEHIITCSLKAGE